MKSLLSLVCLLLCFQSKAQISFSDPARLDTYGPVSDVSQYVIITAGNRVNIWNWSTRCDTMSSLMVHRGNNSWPGCWVQSTNAYLTFKNGLVRMGDTIMADTARLLTTSSVAAAIKGSDTVNWNGKANKTTVDSINVVVSGFPAMLMGNYVTISKSSADSNYYEAVIAAIKNKAKNDSTVNANAVAGKAVVGSSYTKSESESRYLKSEVDGSTTNELQTLNLAGQTLAISSGNSVVLPLQDLSGYATNDALAGKSDLGVSFTKGESDAKYLQNEVDGSVSNELQTISVGTGMFTLSNGGGTYTEIDPVWLSQKGSYLTTASANSTFITSTTANSSFLKPADTVALANKVNAAVKYTDTSSLLSPYLKSNTAALTYATITQDALKLKITDTTGKWLSAGYTPPSTNLTSSILGNTVTVNSSTGSGTSFVLPLDGSATKINAGTNVSVTGSGTVAAPYVVNATVTSITATTPLTGGVITSSGSIGIQDAVADNVTKGAASFDSSQFSSTAGNIKSSLKYGTGTVASNAVTINALRGKITVPQTPILAAQAATVTFTNSYITATSIITPNINSNGVNLPLPLFCYVKSQGSGTCTINILNVSLLTTLNQAFVIDFIINN